MRIGVLAVQGAFIEHEKMLERLGAEAVEIRQKKDFENLDGLILPGGESTVQGQLLKKLDLFDDIRASINAGLPVLATCAGLILLAEKIENDDTVHFGTLPVTVKRNAYGRQLGSFTSNSSLGNINDFPFVFIRAPYITKADPQVEILSEVDGNIVGVRYKNQIGLAFHPEMTDDTRIHEKFLNLCRAAAAKAA
ncbi:pyridoxal 5'-phosphate synthase glutaminase subunit PdxT [Lachnospiraceae bacterium C1.1]|nr:pyridoxal 5'-phosphate synthase glutaminase subunit PdxT [Lachnospiraceae bacterium C1.1]